MKVIFLEICGVLNSDRWFESVKMVAKDPAQAVEKVIFDPVAMARVNRLMPERPQVVITSELRKRAELKTSMVRNRFLLDFHKDWYTSILFNSPKRVQIKDWLRRHPNVTAAAIIDNDDDMGDLKPLLVQVDSVNGIQSPHIERARELLQNKIV